MDYVCGLCVQATDPTVVVLAGREHLGWWRLLPEQRTFELFRKADYQVIIMTYSVCLLDSRFRQCVRLFRNYLEVMSIRFIEVYVKDVLSFSVVIRSLRYHVVLVRSAKYCYRPANSL